MTYLHSYQLQASYLENDTSVDAEEIQAKGLVKDTIESLLE
jgi:hypothetical protein